MKRIGLGFGFAILAACGGGGGGGEPITGTLAIDYGTEHVVPSVGAVIESVEDPSQMMVMVGTSQVDCGIDLEHDSPDNGTYLLFSVDPAVGAYAPFVSVLRVDNDGISLNASGGDVTIDAIGERVTGSLANFDANDDEVGLITASGTFDVLNCL